MCPKRVRGSSERRLPWQVSWTLDTGCRDLLVSLTERSHSEAFSRYSQPAVLRTSYLRSVLPLSVLGAHVRFHRMACIHQFKIRPLSLKYHISSLHKLLGLARPVRLFYCGAGCRMSSACWLPAASAVVLSSAAVPAPHPRQLAAQASGLRNCGG